MEIAEEFIVENNRAVKLYGIKWSAGTVCFTDDLKEAENLLEFIIENEVEENQIFDVIEDLFYT